MGAPHPFFRALLEKRKDASVPDFSDLPPAKARALMRSMVAAAPPAQDLPEIAACEDLTVAGPGGPIPIRRYLPFGQPGGTCLYLHAGGWVIGDLDTGDKTCRRIAGRAGIEVVSVDYRLAPEHPFPAPLDDCYAALQWCAARRPAGLIVAGESAGGNLAAAVAIRARDQAGPAIAGQILIYGVMDHDFATPSYQQIGDRPWMLTTADMRYFWHHYCPDAALRNDPLLSPLRVATAARLPPAFIAVGELDVLRDECVAYAERLKAAGVPVVQRVDAGMLHGYYAMTEFAEPARATMAATIDWIRLRLAPPMPHAQTGQTR